MGGQVEIGAVGDPLELAPLRTGESEAVLQVDGALGVVGELLLRVLVEPDVPRIDAQIHVPGPAVVDPVLVPLLVGARLAEELHLHLLELAGAEDEVARGDLVAEGLADLADAEGRLLAGRAHDIDEVDEDALSGLGSQVVQAGLVVDGAEIGLEQAGEGPRLGPRARLTGDRIRHVGEIDGLGVQTLARGVLLDELVGTVAPVGVEGLHERVGERAHVPGGHPCLARQDDRGVQTDDVVAGADHVLPPLAFDVLLELDAERAVVPGRAGPAVDLPAGEDETTPLGQVDDALERGGGLCHRCVSWCRRTSAPGRWERRNTVILRVRPPAPRPGGGRVGRGLRDV